MRRCPHCNRKIDTHATEPPSYCPHCAEELPALKDSLEWASVARLSNLAEVGYFDWLLQSAEIPTRVHERDDFDAVSGAWHKAFVLQVPATEADKAAALLEEELQQMPEGDDTSPLASEHEPNETQVLFWPLALILVAGGLVYLAERGALPFFRGDAPISKRDTLWNSIKESRRPLVTDGAPGQSRRALFFDRRRQHFILQDDLDGDGFYDRRREFDADGIAVD